MGDSQSEQVDENGEACPVDLPEQGVGPQITIETKHGTDVTGDSSRIPRH